MANPRGVNLNFPTCPEPRVIAFLEANHIDPLNTPAAQEVLVTGEHLAYVEFSRDEEGNRILGGDGFLKHLKVVPLLSAPENHGL